MQVTIVGVKKFKYGKEGAQTDGYNYYALKEFKAYDQETSECEGKDVVVEFSRRDFGIHPGDVVNFDYEPGYQGKAQLENVQILKIAGNPFEKDKPADKAAEKK